MKIGGSLFGLNFSAKGMSIQRKKMDLISQNIANADSVRTENGEPYKRKYLKVEVEKNNFAENLSIESKTIRLNTTNPNHISNIQLPEELKIEADQGKAKLNEMIDIKPGDIIYMPEHPDANKDGYVEMSNVNVINEMVEMIAATRTYEANLQALNSAKQMAKDSLEI
ncbi:MAG: flagellar basal body rod protein FlgC [Melioribacteraceae bacterium]|nr:flagellar basal body rod protein FlgC [Melioribacteraceae bacterium]